MDRISILTETGMLSLIGNLTVNPFASLFSGILVSFWFLGSCYITTKPNKYILASPGLFNSLLFLVLTYLGLPANRELPAS